MTIDAIDACGMVQTRPIEQRLQGWISCLLFAADYMVRALDIRRSAEEERYYHDLTRLHRKLRMNGMPAPPLPVANERVRLPELFAGFDRYVAKTERWVNPVLHPARLLRSFFESESLSYRQHAFATGRLLAQGICRIALTMEGYQLVPGYLRPPRHLSDAVKQRMSALFWHGLVKSLRPFMDRAHQRLYNAQEISALLSVLANSVSRRQKAAASSANPYALN